MIICLTLPQEIITDGPIPVNRHVLSEPPTKEDTRLGRDGRLFIYKLAP